MSIQQNHGEPVNTESANITEEHLKQFKKLFPQVFSEGDKIDWEKLQHTLGGIIDDSPERYSFTWAGKKDAIRLLQTPTRATLEPCPEESVNFNETENFFIEGDNLEVLKLLYKSYFGKIKMIYIDPPYNTGSDFIYPDDYRDPLEQYLKISGQKDDKGNLLTSNINKNGRIHSSWLSMMYPRLFVARQLLREDGIIFISIDDREFFNLRIMLNEIFGEENFLSTFTWVNEGNIDNQSKIKRNHEYIITYAKNESLISPPPVIDPNIPRDSKLYREYVDNTIVKNGPANPVTDITLPPGFPANFEKGKIKPKENFWPKLSGVVEVENFKTKNEVVVSSGWSSRFVFEKFIETGFRPVLDSKKQESTFYISETGAVCVRKKRLKNQSHVLTVLRGMGTVQAASAKLSEMGISFDYPKPVSLMKYLVKVGSNKDGIIMDFFSGCCPMAEAVMELNQEDQGVRRFIMVQLPEPCEEGSEPFKAGFKSISDIGKERIRRVIAKMEDEKQNGEERGFKVFKLAESSFEAWKGIKEDKPEEYIKQMKLFVDPLKPGWKEEDVIYELAIKEGYGLSISLERVESVTDNTVYKVTDPDKNQFFYICLDKAITLESLNPLELTRDHLFICRDVALNDETAANLALQCRLKTI